MRVSRDKREKEREKQREREPGKGNSSAEAKANSALNVVTNSHKGIRGGSFETPDDRPDRERARDLLAAARFI